MIRLATVLAVAVAGVLVPATAGYAMSPGQMAQLNVKATDTTECSQPDVCDVCVDHQDPATTVHYCTL